MKAFALILTVIAAVVTASTLPEPRLRVNVDEGVITLNDVNEGTVLGNTTFERWGVVAPTQDKLRHVALDVTAAVIAGHGRREHSVTPGARVYTLAEKNNQTALK